LAVNSLKGETAMIRKKILNPERIRSIKGGGFSFIPHRFVTDGFLQRLSGAELLLYLFLTAVSDRYGLSFYSDESICTLLHMSSENYQSAIKGLIHKDLIAFNGTLFQVLELPAVGPRRARALSGGAGQALPQPI
jgi:hypothetical protein